MKKKLLRWCLPALIFSLLLLGCRNEDFTGQYVNSKREEAFFREALSKTSRLRNNKTIIDALKKQNERSHFVSRMKDQSGLPMWDKVQTIRKSKTTNKGESGDGTEGYIIPLTENEKTLSSILFVTKESDESFLVKDIDNERLKQDIFNTQIDKAVREQMLLDFVLTDYLSFSRDAIYWNIPDDLLSFIPKDPNHPQRRFQIRVPALGSGGGVSDLNDSPMCISWVTNCTCPASWGGCDHCNNEGQCMDHEICGVSGYGDGGYYGGDGGGDGDGGYTGPNTGGENGGGSDGGGGTWNPNDPGGNGGTTDCNSPNKAFYKIVPGCDDEGDEGPNTVDICDKLSTQKSNVKFTNSVTTLKSNLPLKKETGFVEKTNGTFDYKDNGTATESTNALTLGDPTADMLGYLHTHPNDYYNSNDELRIGFKIFSPADVIYFNQMVALAKASNIPLTDIYAVVVTSKGNYQIRFTGNVNQIKTSYTNTKYEYNEMYKEYFVRNNKRSDEVNFLKFIDEKMYVKGITLVKMNDNGTFTKKTLNSDKTDVANDDCQ